MVEGWDTDAGLGVTGYFLPTARWDLAAGTGTDGRIYAVSGMIQNTTDCSATTTSVVEAYSASTFRWW